MLAMSSLAAARRLHQQRKLQQLQQQQLNRVDAKTTNTDATLDNQLQSFLDKNAATTALPRYAANKVFVRDEHSLPTHFLPTVAPAPLPTALLEPEPMQPIHYLHQDQQQPPSGNTMMLISSPESIIESHSDLFACINMAIQQPYQIHRQQQDHINYFERIHHNPLADVMLNTLAPDSFSYTVATPLQPPRLDFFNSTPTTWFDHTLQVSTDLASSISSPTSWSGTTPSPPQQMYYDSILSQTYPTAAQPTPPQPFADPFACTPR
ncbi:hypothetical protein HK101_012074, partial [Irineochytrium annulatum]